MPTVCERRPLVIDSAANLEARIEGQRIILRNVRDQDVSEGYCLWMNDPEVVQYLETRFHPTFLYESLWLLIGFILLIFLNNRFRDSWRSGTLFGLFMIWWGGGRAWVELFRPDQPKIGAGPISYSMIISIAIALAGVLLLLYRYDKLPDGPRERRRKRRRVRKPKPRREIEAE